MTRELRSGGWLFAVIPLSIALAANAAQPLDGGWKGALDASPTWFVELFIDTSPGAISIARGASFYLPSAEGAYRNTNYPLEPIALDPAGHFSVTWSDVSATSPPPGGDGFSVLYSHPFEWTLEGTFTSPTEVSGTVTHRTFADSRATRDNGEVFCVYPCKDTVDAFPWSATHCSCVPPKTASITPAALPDATVDVPYSVAIDGGGDIYGLYLGPRLPSWLRIVDSTLIGTPDESSAGTPVDLFVNGPSGNAGVTYTLVVHPGQYERLTRPSDAIDSIYRDGNGSFVHSDDSPESEGVANAIDRNLSTKYLNFRKTAGLIVVPTGATSLAANGTGASTASSLPLNAIRFTTANDAAERDPLAFEIYGSDDPNPSPSSLWTWIATSDTGLAGSTERLARGPIRRLRNATAYRSYLLIFTALRDASAANSVQIAEVELLASTTPPKRRAARH